MSPPDQPHEFADREAWRAWLAKHHTTADEAWLIHYKKRHRQGKLSLEAAVEEALCFGWIDSRLKPIDDRRYALRYSPRRPNSIWSATNIERVEQLVAEGRMTAAGLEKIAEAKANGQWELALRIERVDEIPPDLEQALSEHEGALKAYRALTDSRKKQFLYWLLSAKRPDTKGRRIQAILQEVQSTQTSG